MLVVQPPPPLASFFRNDAVGDLNSLDKVVDLENRTTSSGQGVLIRSANTPVSSATLVESSDRVSGPSRDTKKKNNSFR